MLITLLVGSIAAAFLGVVYSCIVVYVGIIYLNFLLAVLYGFGIGKAVAWGAKIGHARTKIFPASAAVVVGLIGLYFAWATDMVARFKLPLADHRFLRALEPNVLAAYVRYFYDHGLWTINFAHGANNPNGGPVSGIPLAAIWLAEAGMIIGTAAYSSWKAMIDLVYCERCEKWVKQTKDVRRLRLAMTPADLAQIAQGDLRPLSTLPRANKQEPNFLRLDLENCEKCSESNFLTISRVMTVIDKKGKKRQQLTSQLRALAINADDVALVREAGVEVVPPAFQVAPAPPVGEQSDDETAVATDRAGASDGEPPAKQPWE